MKTGFLLGAIVWLVAGCTAILWSDNSTIETDTEYGIVIDSGNDEEKKDEYNRK